MKIVFSSGNKNKIREFREILLDNGIDIEVLSLKDIEFEGDIEENGTTFEENATIKARVPASLGYIGVADDSGLEVDALNGAPGVYSARFAGEPCDDRKNNEKLLDLLKDVPDEKRTARFVSVISCVMPYETEARIISRGTCEGTMIHEYRGDGGFGYDPLFLVNGANKTFAEMNDTEKNAVSHRGKAVRDFCQNFKKVIYDV
ncbi:MAG: XTP/dITP diphosphatase [Ruminococcaceae bacterium]|nr:XTP/dITP diphosphatase [Oscillospiraceae bacterium]